MSNLSNIKANISEIHGDDSQPSGSDNMNQNNVNEEGNSDISDRSESIKTEEDTARHADISPEQELNTIKHIDSPDNSSESVDNVRQEDMKIFGNQLDVNRKYAESEDGSEEEFFFDSNLHITLDIEEQIESAELIRPERLDTLEEVSEPVSTNHSLQHDNWRWPDPHSEHTSITSTDHMASLTIQAEENREEMYSLAEMEFRNSFRRQHSLSGLDKSYSSLPSFASNQEIRDNDDVDRTSHHIKHIGEGTQEEDCFEEVSG